MRRGRRRRAGWGTRCALALVGSALLTGCAPDAQPTDGPGREQATGPAYPAASATAPAVTSSPSYGAVAAGCPKSGVRIASLGVSAAMGLRALGLELVNCGTRTYRIEGYPTLVVRDKQRAVIPLRVINGAKEITSGFDDPPTVVTLRPGERAGAAVLWKNRNTDPTVIPTEGAYLEVGPRAGQSMTSVETYGPIDLGTTNRIGVSAWRLLDDAAPSSPASPDGRPDTPPTATVPPLR